MAKHLKSSATNMRHSDTINAHTLWAVMNPEYAHDDIRVERELEAMDEELRQAWSGDTVIWSAHGFNGHDPHDENDHLARFPKSGIYTHDWHDPDPRFEDDGHDHRFYDEYDYDWPEERAAKKRQREIDDWYDDYPQYEYPEHAREAQEESLRCEDNPEAPDYLDDVYSHPYTQSLRMAVREEVRGSMGWCRWNRRPYERHERKRSHCGEGVHFQWADVWNAHNVLRAKAKWKRDQPATKRPLVQDWFKSA